MGRASGVSQGEHVYSVSLKGSWSGDPYYVAQFTANYLKCDVDMMQATPWNVVEDTLLKLSHVPGVCIRLHDKEAFKWLMRSILDRSVFARIIAAGQTMPLIGYKRHQGLSPNGSRHWKVVIDKNDREDLKMDGMLSAPTEYFLDNYPVRLENPLQRFEYLSCRDTSEKEAYLRDVLREIGEDT
ncbi:uncharacterized protein PHACADRAFT_261492 [Phanerochaete carnosa HHB-10118-sp]|uniref:Uncharacterized protein n=1 Tax=Phanerochaete carnosa (strain HHB-10118-sp) TaxID=650164 RepID=K5W1U2_PHACS|nr:uncharacterized protein PHACADRAFT_261492 [Phanerochaete carnosa HHB-10118-sp]EKM52839.1 hypothetical protein PHACADRAFT_261492 [Phanerochaete carnosa HHB-10118-sp]